MPDLIFEQRLNDLGFDSLPSTLKQKNRPTQPAESKPQLHKNADNTYDISLSRLKSNEHYQFFDGDVCILEVFNTDLGVEIQSHTTDQINITGKIQAFQLQVKSKGAVAFESPIQTDFLEVDASATCFTQPVTVRETVLKCPKGVAILDNFHADNFRCHAKDIYQSGKLEVKGNADIEVSVYQQTAEANIHIGKTARFLADTAFLDADFSVGEKAMLVANRLEFGESSDEVVISKKIDLPANTYIRSQVCQLSASTSLSLNGNAKRPAIWKTDCLFIHANANCALTYANVTGNVIRNEGNLYPSDSQLHLNRLTQEGKLEAKNSYFKIANLFETSGLTRMNLSEANIKTFISRDDTQLTDTALSIYDHFKVMSGQCQFTENSILETAHVSVSQSAKFKMAGSELRVSEQFLSLGDCDFKGINRFDADKAIFYGPVVAEDCYFTPSSMEFNAAVHLKACQGNMESLGFNTHESTAIVDKCRLTMQFLKQQGKFKALNYTSLYGTRNEDCFFFEGEVDLLNTNIVMNGNVYFESQTNVDRFKGLIQAKKIENRAAVSTDQLLLFSQIFRQNKANLSLKDSCFYLQDLFDSMQSSIAADHSEVTATTLRHQGELSLSHSTLKSTHQTLEAETLLAEDIQVSPRQTILRVNTEGAAVRLMAEEVQIYNKFDFDRSGFLVKEYVSLRPGAKGKLKKTIVTANDIDTYADLTLSNSTLQATHYLVARPESHTHIKGTVSFKSEHRVYLQGEITKSKPVIGEAWEQAEEPADEQQPLKIQEMPKTTLLVTAKEELDISATAKIALDSLQLAAETARNRGKITLEEALQFKGNSFLNENLLSADIATICANYGFINLGGKTSARNILIQANTFNLFGRLYARENYSQTGFIGFNMGLVSGSNVHSNNLLSFNTGLVLPNFSADPNFWFSSNNLYMIARTSVSHFLPQFNNALSLAFAVPSFLNGASGLYQLSKKYDTWEKIENAELYELMPAVCQIKSAVTMTMAAVSNGSNLGQDFKSLSSGFKHSFDDFNRWMQLGKQSLSILGGHYVDDSLIGVNAGMTFAQNTARSCLFSLNTAIEASLQNHSVNSYCMVNTGFSGGDQSVFSVRHGMNAGILYGHSGLNLQFANLHNQQSGSIEGHGISGKIMHFEQEGETKWTDGNITIERFQESQTAKDYWKNIGIKGDTAAFAGLMKAQGVFFDYQQSVKFGKTANATLDEVTIRTTDFYTEAKLGYSHQVSIDATHTVFAEGSRISGAVSKNPVSDTDESSSATPQKPTHVLLVNSQKVLIDGQLSGGDHTQIQGTKDAEGNAQPCDELNFGNHTDVKLNQAHLRSKSSYMDDGGQVSLTRTQAELDHLTIADNALLTLTQSILKGDNLYSDGRLKTSESHLTYNQATLSDKAREHFGNNTLLEFKHFKDNSQLSYHGRVFTESDDYQHGGRIQLKKSDLDDYFSVKTKTASLTGSASIGHGAYEIAQFKDQGQFITGNSRYSNYEFSKKLDYVTPDKLIVDQKMERDCDITAEASDIQWNSAIDNQHLLGLKSTAGDVALTSNMNVGRLLVDSAAKVYTTQAINAKGLLQVTAKGDYYNLGGTITAENIYFKTSNIFNVTQGSAYAAQYQGPHTVGQGGVLNGRQDTLLETTVGNIENHGGIIRGGQYAQLLAKGHIKNIGNVRTYQGKYDVVKEFDPALIAGGTGTEDNDRIGLYVKAEGKVFSDASDLVANGDVYIEGQEGVEFAARHHTYISKEETKRKHCGFSKEYVIETSTNVRGCNIQSFSGRNTIYSGNGRVDGVATNFISPGGTDIYANKKVHLYSLKTQDRSYKEKSSFWGLSNSKRNEIHESATPTLFLDNGTTRIHSATDAVDVRGTIFLGDGDLEIEAAKKIFFGCDVLSHEIHERTRSFGVTVPGMGAWNAYHSGENAWAIMTAEDATLSKLNSLMGSQNSWEGIANASNLGIDLYNTTNNLMRGLATGNLTGEFLSRYNLGSSNGFAPRVTLSYTKTRTDTTYQTLGTGGVDRAGNLRLKSSDGVELHNGVQVKNRGNVDIDAPSIEAHGASLSSTVRHKEKSVNLGITATGEVLDVGASVSKTKIDSTTTVNANLACGGNMKLHHGDGAMDRVLLDGANIESDTIDAHIRKLEITDRLDTSEMETFSAAASSSGQLSFYKKTGNEAAVNQISGIHTKDGLNTDDHQFEVDHAIMVGGKATTEGENAAVIHRLDVTTVQEHSRYDGVGLSLNVNDFSRLDGNGPSNETGEQAIATASFTMNHQRYDAVVQPTIAGAEGTTVQTDLQQIEVNISSMDGRQVLRNTKLHVALDLPITNQEYLNQAGQNIVAGTKKCQQSLFGRAPMLPTEAVPPLLEVSVVTGDEIVAPAVDEKILEASQLSDLPALTPELFEQVIGSMSTEEHQNFDVALNKANQELESTGAISSETETLLMNKFAEATIKTLKTSTEFGWDKLVGSLGAEYSDNMFKMLLTKGMREKGGIKLYMTSKGVMISFAMNLALSGNVPPTQQFKEAVINTADDLIIGFLVGTLTRSPYVLLGLAVADLVDTLTYDEARVKDHLSKAQDYRELAMQEMRDGHWFSAIGLFDYARDFQKSASESEGLHNALKILHPIQQMRQHMTTEPITP